MYSLVLNRVSVGDNHSKEQVFNVVNSNTLELYDVIVPWRPSVDAGGVLDTEITNAMNELDGDLLFRINSQGGDVKASLGIYNAIKRYDRGKTTAIVDGCAFSSAGWIPQACNERKISSGGIFMTHNPQMRPYVGSLKDLDAAKNQWMAFKKSITDIFVEATNIAESEISDMMDAETWLSAEEAVEKGFFDAVDNSVEADLKALNYAAPENIPVNLFKPSEEQKTTSDASILIARRNLLLQRAGKKV